MTRTHLLRRCILWQHEEWGQSLHCCQGLVPFCFCPTALKQRQQAPYKNYAHSDNIVVPHGHRNLSRQRRGLSVGGSKTRTDQYCTADREVITLHSALTELTSTSRASEEGLTVDGRIRTDQYCTADREMVALHSALTTLKSTLQLGEGA